MILWPAAAACALACAALGLRRIRSRYVLVSVAGESMIPDLHHGDRVLVRRSDGGLPERGEVAVLRLSPPRGHNHDMRNGAPRPGPARWAVKRVAALPGDAVPESVGTAVGGVPVVPAGMLVLLGDNPHGSVDSRSWGFVPAADLLGTVVSRMPGGGPFPASDRDARGRPAGPRPAGALVFPVPPQNLR